MENNRMQAFFRHAGFVAAASEHFDTTGRKNSLAVLLDSCPSPSRQASIGRCLVRDGCSTQKKGGAPKNIATVLDHR